MAPLFAVEARDVRKVYRRPVRAPGLAGAIGHLLHPRYTELVAVDGVDLAIRPGEAVGYVGPNGAGKSTTVKLLTGVLRPSAGTVRVLGRDPHRERMGNAQDIGAAFGQRTQLWWDLPVTESLLLLRDIYRVPEARYRQNLAMCTEVLGLGEFLQAPVRQLSLGQRMRADLAAALIHDPQVLYLDEPTIGLDVAVRVRLRELLRMLVRERGLTVLLTSHDLADIEGVCQRLCMIDHGRIVYDGSLQAIRDRFARERVLRFAAQAPGTPAAAALERTFAGLRAMWEGGTLVVRFDRTVVATAAVTAHVLACTDVSDFRMEDAGIEDVVRRLYDRELDLGGAVDP